MVTLYKYKLIITYKELNQITNKNLHVHTLNQNSPFLNWHMYSFRPFKTLFVCWFLTNPLKTTQTQTFYQSVISAIEKKCLDLCCVWFFLHFWRKQLLNYLHTLLKPNFCLLSIFNVKNILLLAQERIS